MQTWKARGWNWKILFPALWFRRTTHSRLWGKRLVVRPSMWGWSHASVLWKCAKGSAMKHKDTPKYFQTELSKRKKRIDQTHKKWLAISHVSVVVAAFFAASRRLMQITFHSHTCLTKHIIAGLVLALLSKALQRLDR